MDAHARPIELTPCANLAMTPLTRDAPYVLRFSEMTVMCEFVPRHVPHRDVLSLAQIEYTGLAENKNYIATICLPR